MISRKQYIIVNATSLDRSGALSILRQFVESIPEDDRKWLVFISPSVKLHTCKKNIRIEQIVGVKQMFKRFWWDILGLKRWLKKNNIDPISAVSLQNTGFNVGKRVPTYIYYHQPIPFYPFKWNPFNKDEKTFWFYKNIYPLFVRFSLNKDTQIFVQLEYIKKGFAERFNHDPNLISVYSPSVKLSLHSTNEAKEISNTIKLIYPAMPYFYKNHRVLKDALALTNRDLELIFTIEIEKDCIGDDRIRFIGSQPYESICNLYQVCDALLFPSYIETYGLPLLEAAMSGLPIIAADLPYAREVLSGYDGVVYVPCDNPIAWANAIQGIEKGKRFVPFDISSQPSWNELFNKIK